MENKTVYYSPCLKGRPDITQGLDSTKSYEITLDDKGNVVEVKEIKYDVGITGKDIGLVIFAGAVCFILIRLANLIIKLGNNISK